ncbi:MAG: hypothetical protein ACLFTE_10345 [Salinivenus sp.]
MVGLPLGTVIALALVVGLPLLAYGLSRVDRSRGDGYVTVLGRRSSSDA